MTDYMFQIYEDYQFDKSNEAIQALRNLSAAFIPGNGSLVPRAVFVSSHPTPQEFNVKRLLSSDIRMGALFDHLLEFGGMMRSDVYVTSVVKFKHPRNEAPGEDLLKESTTLLRREMEFLGRSGCRVIVPFDDISINAIVPATSLSVKKDHGKTINVIGNPWIMFPMIHPSAATKVGITETESDAIKKSMRKDFVKLGTLVNSLVE